MSFVVGFKASLFAIECFLSCVSFCVGTDFAKCTIYLEFSNFCCLLASLTYDIKEYFCEKASQDVSNADWRQPNLFRHVKKSQSETFFLFAFLSSYYKRTFFEFIIHRNYYKISNFDTQKINFGKEHKKA